MLASKVTRAVFPDVPVPPVPGERVSFSLASLGNGPLMTAVVKAAEKPGVIGMRVFAHADELPHLDLTVLRHRGRATTLTEWTSVPEDMLRIGPTLRLTFLDTSETIEVLDYLPRYETA